MSKSDLFDIEAFDSEYITLTKASTEFSIKKHELRRWMREPKPLPHVKGENGWIMVRRGDVRQFKLEKYPPYHQDGSNNLSPNKNYFTIAQAAAASGYTNRAIRNMIHHPDNPMPAIRDPHDPRGRYLIDCDVFWNYLKNRGLKEPKETNERVELIKMYPELEKLPGTFHSIQETAHALNIKPQTLYRMVRRPVKPLKSYKPSKTILISKYDMAEFIADSEMAVM